MVSWDEAANIARRTEAAEEQELRLRQEAERQSLALIAEAHLALQTRYS